MSQNIGSATIIPGIPNSFQAINSGIQGLLIGNKSGYELNIQLEGCGIAKTLYPGSIDFFPYQYGFSGNVIFSTVTSLPNILNYPGKTVTFDAIGKQESFNQSAYPMSIAAVQAVSPTASGKPLFSATIGFGATTTNNQGLNIFNPPNSGVVLNFHSARVYTNDATGPSCNLIFLTGTDQNWALPVSAISHTGNAPAPVSATHCTAQDGSIGLSGSLIEVINVGAMVETDMLAFPDNVQLYPGGNMYIEIASGTSGHVVRLTMKWSEDTQAPPIFVQGATAVASSVKNDGNPAGTQILESTVSGDASSAVILTNDAQFTLGDVAHNALLTILGNMIQNGNFTLDGASNTGIKVNTSSVHLVGGTSGTADLYQIFQGTFKYTIIDLTNFRTSAGAQTIALPVAYTSGAYIRGSDTDSYSLLLSGVAQSLATITALPAAAGGNATTGNATNLGFYALGSCLTGFDTIRFNGGWAAAHQGQIIIEGI